jgi:hypothetical protein
VAVVSDELLFTVVGSAAWPAEPISLAEAGLKERTDLQEWVIAHPAMLGVGVKVVTFEFSSWTSGTGSAVLDRLDVLGLGQDGRLVVAELKRGKAPDTTQMQAVKYAAMTSRFSPKSLAAQYARFRFSRKEVLSDQDALLELQEHAPELSIETLRRPRIVLVAQDYPPSVTASAVWLSEMGLDVSLVQFQAYRTTVPGSGEGGHSQVLVSVSRLYPVRNVEEFMVSPTQQQSREAAESGARVKESSAVQKLINAGEIADGTILTFEPTGEISEDLRSVVDQWLEQESRRRTATWYNSPTAPLRWGGDDAYYTPTGLASHIVREATGIKPNFWGPRWWRNADGWTLVELAAPYGGGKPELYEYFWTQWIERVHTEHSSWSQATIPQRHNWISMPSPVKGTHIGNSLPTNARLRSELYINGGTKEANFELFDQLRSKSHEIEKAYGRALSWEPLSNRNVCRIADYVDGDVTDVVNHEAYIDWMFDAGARLRKALASVGYGR